MECSVQQQEEEWMVEEEPHTIRTTSSSSCSSSNSSGLSGRRRKRGVDGDAGGDGDRDGDRSPVLVEEEEVFQLWIPGRVLHLYAHRGVYRARSVPRDFPPLRRVQVQGNLFQDHTGMAIYEALQEVRAAMRAPCAAPAWTPYHASASCQRCLCSFTWHSTFRGEAQEYRERYNCRSCGLLVCGPCSTHRQPVARLGLLTLERICDACFYQGTYADMQNPIIVTQQAKT